MILLIGENCTFFTVVEPEKFQWGGQGETRGNFGVAQKSEYAYKVSRR